MQIVWSFMYAVISSANKDYLTSFQLVSPYCLITLAMTASTNRHGIEIGILSCS